MLPIETVFDAIAAYWLAYRQISSYPALQLTSVDLETQRIHSLFVPPQSLALPLRLMPESYTAPRMIASYNAPGRTDFSGSTTIGEEIIDENLSDEIIRGNDVEIEPHDPSRFLLATNGIDIDQA